MSAAWSRGSRKFLRTVIQLIAGGALTALVTAVAGGLNPTVAGIVLGAWTALVALAQNTAESAGKIPVLLPTPGLVQGTGKILTPVAGTVDAVAEKIGDTVGEVTGTVQDTAGELLGEIVDVDMRGDHEQ